MPELRAPSGGIGSEPKQKKGKKGKFQDDDVSGGIKPLDGLDLDIFDKEGEKKKD